MLITVQPDLNWPLSLAQLSPSLFLTILGVGELDSVSIVFSSELTLS